MQMIIIFYKSSSKYYDSCCLQCEQFLSYINEKNKNTLTIEDKELKEKQDSIAAIISIIRNWSKSEYYLDDKKVSIQQIDGLLNLLKCEDAKANEVVGNHCFTFNGWGCNNLEEIALRNTERYYSRHKYYWYEFGRYIDGAWKVDKNRMKEKLEEEAQRKNLSLCSFFDIDRVFGVIENLPDEIIVDENDENCEWQYKYREAPAGIRQTEIIGVEPKEKKEPWGLSIGISRINSDEHRTQEESELKNVPSVTFSDIGGIDSIIQQVREVIELPLISPEIFEYYQLIPHKGILLYGPPGCGKTLIAKAIANEINAHFIAVNGPEILNKFYGQSEENLRRIFDEAKKYKPSIIYFDEFDSLSMTRDSDNYLVSATIVNQLLTLLDGMNAKEVCCIASTNRIDMIDEAVKRTGRFDYVIEIEKPSIEGCKAIFKIHTNKMPLDRSFNRDAFAEKYLAGLSGAEIAFVASEAAYNSIRRTIDIESIFMGEKASLSDSNIVAEIDFLRAVKTLKERKNKAFAAQFKN